MTYRIEAECVSRLGNREWLRLSSAEYPTLAEAEVSMTRLQRSTKQRLRVVKV